MCQKNAMLGHLSLASRHIKKFSNRPCLSEKKHFELLPTFVLMLANLGHLTHMMLELHLKVSLILKLLATMMQ